MNLSHLPIPLAVLYAGLAGTILALIVATWQNKWSCRVFFLLALRLAIGWHFLFEGLHKLHTHYVGETATNKPFTSEPYFAAAEGPLGPVMKQRFGDVEEQIQLKVEPHELPNSVKDLDPNQRVRTGFATAKDADYAGWVPTSVRSDWKEFVDEFATRYKLTEAERKRLDGVIDDDERKELEEQEGKQKEADDLKLADSGLVSRQLAAEWKLGELRKKANDPKATAEAEAVEAELVQIAAERQKIADDQKQVAKRLAELSVSGDLTVKALAEYGRWVAGAEGRPSKMKFVGGSEDPRLTAPQRLAYIKARERDLEELKKRAEAELGRGQGLEMARVREMKGLINQAKSALVTDADAYVLDLKKNVFTTLMQVRIGKQAPVPSESVGKDAALFDKLVPAPGASAAEPLAFDQLPTGVQELWTKYRDSAKADYPDIAAGDIDQSFEAAKIRVANWYTGRDELTGKHPKLELLDKRAADIAERLKDLKLTDDEQKKLKAEAGQVADERAKAVKSLPLPAHLAAAERYHKAKTRAATARQTAEKATGLERLRLAAIARGEDQTAENAKQAILLEYDGRYKSLQDTLKTGLPAEATNWPVAAKPDKSKGELMDKTTQWFLIVVGALLLAGLGTRIACVAGAVFLVLTYLTHPPFPWLPQPPNTEGNPLFINKNVIEMLGLLVIMSFPTGRWMGLDAIIHKVFHWKAPEPT